MPSFGTRLAAASIEVDLSAVRITTSARRAVVVAAALIVGLHLGLNQVGVSAAMAALLVGLLDKGPSPRRAWHSMITSTALFTLITLAAGLASHLVIVNVVLMALLAAMAGIGFSVNPRSTQVLIFAAVMAASYSVRPISPDIALEAAIGVLLAGSLQAVLVIVTGPLIRDWPERRQVIIAVKAVRDLMAQVGAGIDTLEAARRASKELDQAQRVLNSSDLPADRLDQYWLILDDVDSLRLEARALAGRSRLGLPGPSDNQSRAALAAGAQVLQAAIGALICRFTKARSECQIMWQRIEQLTEIATPSDPNTKPHIAAETVAITATRLGDVVESMTSRFSPHRVSRPATEPLARRLRTALGPGSVGRRHAMRMAGAAVFGEAIGMALGLAYSSWVAVTAMMILRPDVGPTIPRIITRALGATIGVVIVVAVFALGPGSSVAMVALVGLLAWSVFTFAPVNNALMTGLMTALVITLLALAGHDPQQVAAERLFDVVVGCVVGAAFAVLIPVWTRDRLQSAVGEYARTAAAYLRTIGEGMIGGSEAMRARARQARSTGRAAEADLRTSLLEPGSRYVRPSEMSIVIAWIQRANEAGVVAEMALRHGAELGTHSTDLAQAAAASLESAANVVEAGQRTGLAIESRPKVTMLAEVATGSGIVDQCLWRATRCAEAASRAAVRGTRTVSSQ